MSRLIFCRVAWLAFSVVVLAGGFGCGRPPAAPAARPSSETDSTAGTQSPADVLKGAPTAADKRPAPHQDAGAAHYEGKPLREWIGSLGDDDVRIRSDAVDAVARIGRPAVVELVAALRSPNPRLRQNAARALGRIGEPAKAVAGELAGSLADEDAHVRIASAAALVRVDPERAKPALDVLVAVLQEKGEAAYVNQMAAVWELGELGPVAKPAVPALNSLVWPGFGDPLEQAATAALKKIEPGPAPSDRFTWDDVIGDKPTRPGAGAAPDPVASGSLAHWQDVVRAVGGQAEAGRRAGQRFLLLSGRLMLVEGTNALDLFFPPTREGIEAGAAFMSSPLFTPEEKKGLLALGERKDREQVAGRFRLRLGYTDGANSDLPAHWIRVEFEPVDRSGKAVAHAVLLAGSCTDDELFTRSKHRELNKLVRSHLGAKYPPKELSLRVRTLNNLADAAGFSGTATLAAVERAVQEAKRTGLEPSFGIDAAEKSFSLVVAMNKEALDRTGRADAKEGPKEPEPIDPKVVAAWEKAGAGLFWMRIDPVQALFEEVKHPRPGDLPTFHFIKPIPPATLGRLPQPAVPFAVRVPWKQPGVASQDTDAMLKALSTFDTLAALDLFLSDVTDDGILLLPKLRGLRAINLNGTGVTGKTLDVLTKLEGLTTLSLRAVNVRDDALDDLAGCKALLALDLSETRVTDAGVKHLTRFPRLRALTLEGTKLTDAGVKALAKCEALRSLCLFSNEITWAALRPLGEGRRLERLAFTGSEVTEADLEVLGLFTGLRDLNLDRTKVTDAALKTIGGLKRLQRLVLRGGGVTDEGLKHLAGLGELRALILRETAIGDAGVKELVKLTELRVLAVGGSNVTDRGLEDVARLAHLEELGLASLKVTDDGMKAVAKLGKLRSLDLSGTRVTDDGLKELYGAKLLRSLDLGGSRVTPDGIVELKKALPEVSVTR